MKWNELTNNWRILVEEEFTKPYFLSIEDFLEKAYANTTVYPVQHKIFEALNLTDYKNIKVVILGQDPYHGENQAHGLSFSVLPGITKPPSLRNILKEIELEYGYPIPQNGNLECLAKQGVLLLNTVLTVEASKPASHSKIGWQIFTDFIISQVNLIETPVVYMLWGSYAQSKKGLITNTKHLVLEAPHPSPLSAHRGYIGCEHFKKANQFLKDQHIEPINWCVN